MLLLLFHKCAKIQEDIRWIIRTKNYKTQFILYSAIAMTIYWALLFYGNKTRRLITSGKCCYADSLLHTACSGLWPQSTGTGLKRATSVKEYLLYFSCCYRVGVLVKEYGHIVISNPAKRGAHKQTYWPLYMTSIPLWVYGILRLSKATGARYALKSLSQSGKRL